MTTKGKVLWTGKVMGGTKWTVTVEIDEEGWVPKATDMLWLVAHRFPDQPTQSEPLKWSYDPHKGWVNVNDPKWVPAPVESLYP